jgi:hypothetical protein
MFIIIYFQDEEYNPTVSFQSLQAQARDFLRSKFEILTRPFPLKAR